MNPVIKISWDYLGCFSPPSFSYPTAIIAVYLVSDERLRSPLPQPHLFLNTHPQTFLSLYPLLVVCFLPVKHSFTPYKKTANVLAYKII